MILFCGIQATGKTSFYAAKFLKTHIRLSLDMLHTRNKEDHFLQTCFMLRQRFVVDNTNLTIAERSKYMLLAKQHKFKVIGYAFESVVEDAIVRNSSRVHKENIPEKGIRASFKKLQWPSVEEGFHHLYGVKIRDHNFIIEEWRV